MPHHEILYPRNELAPCHSAGVEAETHRPADAYAGFPAWLPGRPAALPRMPWDAAP